MENTIKIFDISLHEVNSNSLIRRIKQAILENKKITIGYATANTLNLIYHDASLKKTFSSFDLIHPDGIGTFFASKVLYSKEGFKQRFTGSDFYNYFWSEINKNKWGVFFWGDDEFTLQKTKQNDENNLILGVQNGYQYSVEEVIATINKASPKILIVGMGTPKQEKLVELVLNRINTNVVICVGDGIKVFAGTKVRGPKFVQILGFEWLIRFVNSPKKYFKRYIIGNSLFIWRIFKYKQRNSNA